MGIEDKKQSKEQPLKKEVESALEQGDSVEVLRNISFREIKDKEGNLIAFKSGEFGRKSINLDRGEFNLDRPDLDKTYTVQITGDSNPEDPFSGEYTAQLIDEDGDIAHKESLLERSSRIRNSDSMRSMLEIVNNDPDLFAELRMVTERAEEFKALQITEKERHRAFTALFSGLMMSRRSKDMLNLAIDRTVTEDSDTIKADMEQGNNYVPEAIIGSGVHGAIYNTTRQMYAHDNPSLTIESSSRIGGQFAGPDRALFRKNDRQRPERRNKKHLPGTNQSLTNFGEFATIQPSDFGGEAYPHQSTTSDSARVNFFLSGRAIVDCKTERIILNPDYNSRDETGGKYLVECYDRGEDKVRQLATDRVVFTSGLGEERIGLNEQDETTTEIIAEEKEKFANGEDAKVMSFEEFTSKMGDESIPYPMQGIKNLIISGDGDSAVVIAGIALGYESQIGKTTTQLDSVEAITWIGPKWLTKEEFCEKARARYHWVGLEFPREQFEEYYHRINPVKDGRAYELERDGDNIVVKCATKGSRRGEGRLLLRDDNFSVDTKDIVGDHYVYAHGFIDKTDEAVAPVYNDVYENGDPRMPQVIDEAFYTGNTQIYFKEGSVKKIQVIDTTERGDNVWRALSASGEIISTFESYGPNNFPQEYLNLNNVKRLEFSVRQRGPTTDVVLNDGVSFNQDRDIIASRYDATDFDFYKRDNEIYKVGPVANLPLTNRERSESPALAKVPENTAAIFRYANKTEQIAKKLARLDREMITRPQDSVLGSLKKEKETVIIPSLREKGPRVSNFEIQIPAPNHENRMAYSLDSLDAVKMVLGEELRHVKFPDDMDRLEISVVRADTDETNETSISYTINTNPNLSVESLSQISTVFEDEAFGQMVNRITSMRGSKNAKKVVFAIPMHNNRIDQSNVSYTIPRGK